MKWFGTFFVVVVVWAAVSTADDISPTPVASLIMQRQSNEEIQEGPGETSGTTTTQAPPQTPKPKMYRMHVESRIEYRFANTLISSRIGNPANVSQEVYFSVTLPETAFISKFLMEVDGKVYEATVKEKEEAKKVYDQAVASGQGAAHVAVSARDSNRFTVSVNIEPAKKVNFNLTYEELLIRRLGAYNHVINLDPGQVVNDLRVDVYIKENKDITVLRVPELRSGNEVDADENTTANPLAKIERKTPKEAHITFSPSEAEQKSLGRVKGLDVDTFGPAKVVEGLGGQFVVQYDVDRENKAGEVLVNNGYFVHFFAPKDLAPLPKHVLFVLDVSGSMFGRKMEQLKEAMVAILDDLNEGDYFNIIEFSSSSSFWNLDAREVNEVVTPLGYISYDHKYPPNSGSTPAFPATPKYIAKAKEVVAKMDIVSSTNIYDALKEVLRVAHVGLQNVTSELQRSPIIVFLTDGEPTVGETGLDKILTLVDELNDNPEAAIFSLAFGDDADLDFLKRLSLKNSGFARKIYEASDAALQLRDFYRQIASPLLANVTFSYQPDKIDKNSTTRTHFHTLFSGSEIIVAGRIRPTIDDKTTDEVIEGQISGFSHTGDSIYSIARPDTLPLIVHQEGSAPVTSLERLWAYLTIQQLLESQETKSEEEDEEVKVDNSTSASNDTKLVTPPKDPKKEALKLALQYSFVTKLTSLVVVKPNATNKPDSINPGENIPPRAPGGFGYPVQSSPHLISAGDPGLPARPASFGGSFAGYPGQPGQAVRPGSSGGSFAGYPGPAGQAGSPGISGGSFAGYPGQAGQAGSPGISGGSFAGYPGQAGSPGSSGGSFVGYPGQPGQAGSAGSFGGYPGQPRPSGSPGGYPGQPGSPGSSGSPGQGVSGPGGGISLLQPESEDSEDSEMEGPSFPQVVSTTVHPPPTTDNTKLPPPAPVLITLGELEWLDEASNKSDVVTLPFDDLAGNKTYQLERDNQVIVDLHDCLTVSGVEGQCRHLSQCSLSTFKHDVQSYREYFCTIDNFAGACCPKSLFPQEATTHLDATALISSK